MAIVTENYEVRKDGVQLVRTYSDINHYIISDETGAKYVDAIDPDYKNRTYTESDEEIKEETEEIEADE